MFDLWNNTNQTMIDYTVTVVDTTLLYSFKTLLNPDKKLKKTMYFDKIYIIL